MRNAVATIRAPSASAGFINRSLALAARISRAANQDRPDVVGQDAHSRTVIEQ